MKTSDNKKAPKSPTLTGKSKILLSISLLILTSLTAFAKPPFANKMEIGLFRNSTTCVVIEEAWMAYSIPVKNAMEEYWTLTDYEFIDQDEFENRRHNTRYSFIMFTRGEYEKDPKGVGYNFISLVLADPSDDINKMPQFASIPLSYAGDEGAEFDYAIPAIVQFMQIQVRVLDDKRFWIKLCGLKYYNRGKKFKDKVLLLNKDMMAPEVDTESEIRNVYDYNFKLISTDEMREKLKADAENTLFLFHVGPEEGTAAGKCFEMIFSTSGQLYYYNSRDVTNENPDGFTEKDLKKIS